MLIDSNIIIYCLQPEYSFLRKYIRAENYVSEISRIEVLGYYLITPKQIQDFNLCFDNLNILTIDNLIIEKAIELRQTAKIKLADSLVAATALVNNLSLVTRNNDDFKNIPDLRVINPFDSV